MKKHTHHRKAPLRLLAGSGLLFSLFVPGYSQGAPGRAAAKPSTVLVQKAAAIDSAVNKKYIGQVEAIDRVAVQPRVSGNIVATRFQEGKVVKKGDLLFEIEDTRYRAAVEEAVAKKAQLEAKLLYAKNSFERYNRLLASKSVSMDTVENAKSTMHALEAEIQSANAAITVAKDNLNYTRLTAPITGRTGRVTFSTGNYITPTSGSLVTITGIDEVYVKFPISERDFLSLFGTQEQMKKYALVSVNLANGKAYDQPGRIFMTDNTVQTTTDTLNVWAKFPNPEDELTPGGVVTVNLSKKNVDRFPAANISSVMHDAYKSYVYIVNDQGVVERRDVTLGNTVNNEQCFSSGVKEGEVVIIDGMHKVRPGAKVNPVYSVQNLATHDCGPVYQTPQIRHRHRHPDDAGWRHLPEPAPHCGVSGNRAHQHQRAGHLYGCQRPGGDGNAGLPH